jgi:hypothetical protein
VLDDHRRKAVAAIRDFSHRHRLLSASLPSYTVTLTMPSKGMYVTERSATGFRVREQQSGTSDVRFAYRVVAKRKDIVAERLARVTLPDVSSELKLPDLRLKISLPDFERLPIPPFDLPASSTSE